MRTAAQSHLVLLGEKHPLPDLVSVLSKGELDALGLSMKRLKSGEHDRALDLLSELMGSLPTALLPIIEQGHLVVGEIGIEAPNAHVIPLKDDEFVVVMHSGLFAFLYRVARPLASAVFRTTEEVAGSTGIEMPQLARTIAEIFWWLRKTDTSFGPDYDITREQIYLANLLAMRAERFLLAHEIGHVLQALGERCGELPSGFTDDTTEEYLADALALHLTLDASNKHEGERDPTWLMLTYAGAELALHIWNVMERIDFSFLDDIHPPASKRIEMMRTWLREWCDTDETFGKVTMAAKVIQRAFGEVSRIIMDPAEHAAAFEVEAETLVTEFLDLLETCSSGAIPDYSTFYSQAPILLSRGYPEQTLVMVFRRVVDRLRECMTEPSEKQNPVDQQRRLGQFKLLFGLTDNMPDPAKQVYEAELDALRHTT